MVLMTLQGAGVNESGELTTSKWLIHMAQLAESTLWCLWCHAYCALEVHVKVYA